MICDSHSITWQSSLDWIIQVSKLKGCTISNHISQSTTCKTFHEKHSLRVSECFNTAPPWQSEGKAALPGTRRHECLRGCWVPRSSQWFADSVPYLFRSTCLEPSLYAKTPTRSGVKSESFLRGPVMVSRPGLGNLNGSTPRLSLTLPSQPDRRRRCQPSSSSTETGSPCPIVTTHIPASCVTGARAHGFLRFKQFETLMIRWLDATP